MKQVLIIDASPIFRDFIKSKLDTENVGAEFANGHRDGVTKLLSILPDLVIIDINTSIMDLTEFLEKKKNDINAKRIPMIVCGPVMNKEEVAELVQYGVFKYFSKPIKFDVFFASIGKILKLDFSMDITPCVLDIHLNGKLIFIEIAMGLNREKIMLIRYKLSELIDKTGIKDPKVILMMTDLDLSFIDGTNLELLFSNIIADSRIRRRNIKVLSMSSMVKELIEGHTEYNGIEVASSLSAVLGSLMGADSKPSDGNEMQNLISDKILTSTMEEDDGTVATRFSFEESSEQKKDGGLFKAAILDDDQVVKTMLTAAFQSYGATLDIYSTGADFLANFEAKGYDILILDIFMPNFSGFDVLKALRERNAKIAVIIYTQAMQKEAIVQALSLGAKAYLLKPQKPEAIIQKVTEVLHAQNSK